MRSDLPGKRRFFRLLSLLLAATLVLGACSASDVATDTAEAGSDQDFAAAEESSDDSAEVTEADAVEGESAPAERDAGSGGLSDAAGLPVVDTGRDIIFTATVGVEVEDVVVAGQEASTAIAGLGGVLFGQITTSEGVPRSTLTFKVPPAQFQTALSRLGDIGFLRDQVITADDVTERVVDLESQIITSQLSVDRLRGFLEQATTLTEIADLEQQLLVRETALEQLRGSLRTIEGQVSLATITVTFTQELPGPELTVSQTAYLGHDDGTTCPGLDEIVGDEGDLVTVCYRVTNTGDTVLDDIDVRDEGLGLEMDDLQLVDGSIDEPLAIGASVTFVAEIEAEPFRDGRAQATAISVADSGSDLLLGRTAGRDDLEMSIEEDTSLPGFLDGFSAGWEFMVGLVAIVVLVAGFALPFIWIIPVVWFLRRWFKARKEAKKPPPPAMATAATPPAAPVRPEHVSAPAASVERGQGPETQG